MEFEWDDEKRAANIAKHGVDFLFGARIFRGPVVIETDDRADYGEERLRAVGKVGDEVFVVVYVERNSVLRIISARKGGRRDRRKFEARFA